MLIAGILCAMQKEEVLREAAEHQLEAPKVDPAQVCTYIYCVHTSFHAVVGVHVSAQVGAF